MQSIKNISPTKSPNVKTKHHENDYRNKSKKAEKQKYLTVSGNILIILLSYFFTFLYEGAPIGSTDQDQDPAAQHDIPSTLVSFYWTF